MSVFPSARGGSLVIAACSACGHLLAWLDATADHACISLRLASRVHGAASELVAAFTATPYTGDHHCPLMLPGTAAIRHHCPCLLQLLRVIVTAATVYRRITGTVRLAGRPDSRHV